MGAARGEFIMPLQNPQADKIIGIDEGLISGTLSKSNFVKQLGLDKMSKVELANVKGNISAMVQIGSVGGAALWVLTSILFSGSSLYSSAPSSSVIESVDYGLQDSFAFSGFSELSSS